jgi:hypothetical protein
MQQVELPLQFQTQFLMEKALHLIHLASMEISISTLEVFYFTDQSQRASGLLLKIFKVQRVLQVQVEVMERMAQMEKFQMHRQLQDRLDHKDPQVQQGLRDPRDQLVQQDLQVQVAEHRDQQEQLVHRVHQEVWDLQDLRDQLVRQVPPVQLDLQDRKVKQEQLALQEFQKYQ